MKIFMKVVAIILSVSCIVSGGAGLQGQIVTVEAATENVGQADGDIDNGSFETSDLSMWSTEGSVSIVDTDEYEGSNSVLLSGDEATITQTVGNITQGSYTLTAWIKGSVSGNTAYLRASDTGGPDSQSYIATYIDDSEWTQIAIRNVLVYNGQCTITIYSGSDAKLYVDDIELALDSNDDNPVDNWGFEDSQSTLDGWTLDQGSVSVSEDSDVGESAAVLSSDSQISQVIDVEPNTSYIATVRAKVDKQDTWETTYQSDYRGDTGQLVDVTSYGDRINLGVKDMDGNVLKQAPAGVEDYCLLTVSFTTGPSDTQVTLYVNTINDDAYQDSVEVYGEDAEQDEWESNGDDYAYVDNFDVFEVDNSVIKGADVSFLPLIEDKGGKYFANGVQQDCLRVLSNHGVNAIISMIYVHAGNLVYSWGDSKTPKEGMEDENGDMVDYTTQAGYFDKDHTYELAERAEELGMGYMPSFMFSDTWMSAGKAYTPYDWMYEDEDGELTDQSLDEMTSTIYNYVYDFIDGLEDEGVTPIGVKIGNEENGGICWNTGKSYNSDGFAQLVTAANDAVHDVDPSLSGFLHSNNGYSPSTSNTMFQTLADKGVAFDGMAYSLYGGRATNSIMSMIENNNEEFPYMDYLNAEAGFTFTKYNPDFQDESGSIGQTDYYKNSPNGQYNWLLDYMQAYRDVSNPHDRTRGFFYWEADWIVVDGAGYYTQGGNTVDRRILFNNGDTSIQEMGSSADGKMGDMLESVYAYLWRGYAKDKDEATQTPLQGYGDYSVENSSPTGISLDEDSIDLDVGSYQRLLPTINSDTDYYDWNVDWSVEDDSVATVSDNGTVVAVSSGTTRVTATTEDGGYTATCTVNVDDATLVGSDGMTLTVDGETPAATENVIVNDQLELVTSLNENADNQNVIYTSSNPDVATFLGEYWQSSNPGQFIQQTDVTDSVKLNIVGSGETEITVASVDGSAETSFMVEATKIDVTGIELDQESSTVSVGDTLQLTATVAPEDATYQDVEWTSSDEEVASVDENGLVTTISTGDVTITATSEDDNTIYSTCSISVVPVMVTGITLNKSSLNIMLGDTKQVTAIISPSNAEDQTVNWSIGDTSIASVDEEGNVTGLQIGTTSLTATANDTSGGTYSQTITVRVQKTAIEVTGIEMEEDTYYFSSDYFADTDSEEEAPVYMLTANVLPEDATYSDVTWSSDNPSVATVDEYGQVTALSSGVAIITATSDEGGYTTECTVYVPEISQSFDELEEDDDWSLTDGTAGGSGTMTTSVEEDGDNQVLELSASGTGVRSIEKVFDDPIESNQVEVSFDWDVGAPTDTYGSGQVSIEDSDNHRYLTLQYTQTDGLVYSTGGEATNGVITGNALYEIGDDFDENYETYHIVCDIDFLTNTMDLSVEDTEDSSIVSTITDIPFDTSTSYDDDVAGIQFTMTRKKSTVSWTTALDNFNIYAMGRTIDSVSLSEDSLSLWYESSSQLTASVYPELDTLDDSIVWSSEDTSIATVSEDGLVSGVAAGETTITATSVDNDQVYASCDVTIEDTAVTIEGIGISMDEEQVEGTTVEMSTGDETSLSLTLSTSGILESTTWESSDSSVVSVDEETGLMEALSSGTATITVEVENYTDSVSEASFTVDVTGDSVVDLIDLKAAITEGQEAKTYDDDYYDADSLSNYEEALEDAESCIEDNEDEIWDSSKQSTVDTYTETLENAIANLSKSSTIDIQSIVLEKEQKTLSEGSSFTFLADVYPSYATETNLIWTTSDSAIAVVDDDGVVTGVGEGETEVTVSSEDGSITKTCMINVLGDVSSRFEENGGEITASETNTSSGYKVESPIYNSSTSNTSGPAWNNEGSTYSSGSDWWMIDLGERARIDSLDLAFWSEMKYSVQVSDDGDAWTTAYDSSDEYTGGSDVFEIDMPSATYGRYIRINFDSAEDGYWLGMSLFKANGSFSDDENLTLSSSSIYLIPEETETLTATYGDETENLDIDWSSEDESVASVDSDGKITANSSGTTTIIATIDGTSIKAACTVTVGTDLAYEKTASASSAKSGYPASNVNDGDDSTYWTTGSHSTGATWTVDLGKTYNIESTYIKSWTNFSYTISGSTDGETYDVIYDHSDSLTSGRESTDTMPDETQARYLKVTMTDTENSSDWIALYDFEVFGSVVSGSSGGGSDSESVSSISLSESDMILNPGDTYSLSVTYEPETADAPTIEWSSDDEDIATVDSSGVVTAVSTGSALILAKVSDTDIEDSATVTVIGDLAYGKSASASSAKSSYPASNVNDGDDSTYWTTGSHSTGATWTVDLGKTYNIESTYIKSWTNFSYTISGSTDGETYDVIYDHSDSLTSGRESTDTMPDGTQARYIMVTMTGTESSSDWIALYDFEVFGNSINASDENEVTSITLSKSTMNLYPNESKQLSVAYEPEDADEPVINWSSEDEDIVTVDSDGLVTGISTGSALIVAQVEGTDIEDSCLVTVEEEEEDLYLEDISIETSVTSMEVGDSISLSLEGTDSEGEDADEDLLEDVVWSSSDESIATVDDTGIVTGTGQGSVVISAQIGSLTASIELEITSSVTSITLSKSTMNLYPDETEQLSVSYEPEDADEPVINWSSEDEDIATVDSSGLVTGISNGSALIVAQVEGTDIEDSCLVTVEEEEEDLYLEDISIETSVTSMDVGDSISLSLEGRDSEGEDAAEDLLEDVVWSSSDDSIATVGDSGTVTGRGQGSVVITAQIGSLTASIELEITSSDTGDSSDTEDSSSTSSSNHSTHNDVSYKVVDNSSTSESAKEDYGSVETVEGTNGESIKKVTLDEEYVEDILEDNDSFSFEADLDSGEQEILVFNPFILNSISSTKDVNFVFDKISVDIHRGDTLSTSKNVEIYNDTSDQIQKQLEDSHQESSIEATGEGIQIEYEENTSTSGLNAAFDLSFDLSGLNISEEASTLVNDSDQETLDNEAYQYGIYSYNQDTSQWNYVGGTYDEDNKTLDTTIEETGEYAVFKWIKTFDDVKSGWYKEAIDYLAAKHIASGVDDTHYDPSGAMTRAQFIKLIVSAFDLSENDDSQHFEDVSSDDWYYTAINAAQENGIINGTDGLANPNEKITREEMATILYRTLVSQDIDMTEDEFDLDEIKDVDAISSWASNAVDALLAEGILQGDDEGRFNPTATLTRAEGAQAIYKVLTTIE